MPVPDSTDPGHHTPSRLLDVGELVVRGRMPWSSNATLLCSLLPPGAEVEEVDPAVLDAAPMAIYKPHRGERPLWDFPDGLYRREAAAYALAAALGWDLVPRTVVRDGPYGVGSVQRFVEADVDQHHFTLVEDERHLPQLMRVCAFDLVANSADRKAGHVLIDADDHIWAIDNGLCFHAETKLRTVIWEFAGEPVPDHLRDDLDRFASGPLPPSLVELLDPFERDALRTRARAVADIGRFPHDPTGRRVPWPLV